METAPVSAYCLEFAKRAEWRREEKRRALEQVRHKEEKNMKEHQEQAAGHEALINTVMVAMATKTEITDFNVKLDAYDTATVEALMGNDEALADVRESGPLRPRKPVTDFHSSRSPPDLWFAA